MPAENNSNGLELLTSPATPMEIVTRSLDRKIKVCVARNFNKIKITISK